MRKKITAGPALSRVIDVMAGGILLSDSETRNKFLGSPWVNLILRLLVGGMFLVVALGKIADPAAFAKEINNYGIMPAWTIGSMALILPWLELSCGLMYIFGVRLRANSILIGAMLVVFILGVGTAMAKGLNINCGCYSNIATQKVGWAKILENLGMLWAVCAVYANPAARYSLEHFALSETLNSRG